MMGKLDFGELESFMLSMDELANVPTSVLEDMIEAGGKVVVNEQSKMAKQMGVYDTGTTAASVTPKSVKKTSDGVSLEITFSGNRHRSQTTTRNAEIAFINEFGKRGQPARPFIKTANESCADAMVNSMEAVLDKYYKSIGMG